MSFDIFQNSEEVAPVTWEAYTDWTFQYRGESIYGPVWYGWGPPDEDGFQDGGYFSEVPEGAAIKSPRLKVVS